MTGGFAESTFAHEFLSRKLEELGKASIQLFTPENATSLLTGGAIAKIKHESRPAVAVLHKGKHHEAKAKHSEAKVQNTKNKNMAKEEGECSENDQLLHSPDSRSPKRNRQVVQSKEEDKPHQNAQAPHPEQKTSDEVKTQCGSTKSS